MASLRTSLLSHRAAAAASSSARPWLQLDRQFSLLRVSPAHTARASAGSQILAQTRHRTTSVHRDTGRERERLPADLAANPDLMTELLERYESGRESNPLPEDAPPSLDDYIKQETPQVSSGPARLLPVSRSYFSRQAGFIDVFLEVQALYRKYSGMPLVPQKHVTGSIAWATFHDFKDGRNVVRPALFKQCLAMVKHLHRIHPDIKPEAVKTIVSRFGRAIETSDDKDKIKPLDRHGCAIAVGRRKTSVARAWVVEGTGEMIVNGKSLVDTFGRVHDRESAMWALRSTDRSDKYNVWAQVDGGGTTGQAEALTLAIARALVVHEPALKTALRKAGCITRDHRMVERKKHGHVKARKMPAWVKR